MDNYNISIEELKQEKSLIVEQQANLYAELLELGFEKDRILKYLEIDKENIEYKRRIIIELLLLVVYIFDRNRDFAEYLTTTMLIWSLLMIDLIEIGEIEENKERFCKRYFKGLSNKEIKKKLSLVNKMIAKKELQIFSAELKINFIDGELMKNNINDSVDNIKILKI